MCDFIRNENTFKSNHAGGNWRGNKIRQTKQKNKKNIFS